MNLKHPVTRKSLILAGLLLVIIVIKLFSIDASRVENIYAKQFYVAISGLLRILFGWLPFSFGDIIYFVVVIWLLRKIFIFFNRLIKKQLTLNWFKNTGYRLLVIGMSIYIVFNIFWGINYNRQRISEQLDLPQTGYDTSDLKMIENILLQKVNESKLALIKNNTGYPSDKELFVRAYACYDQCEKIYPFLNYRHHSAKRSLFSWWGNYFGFTGYYNPFTAEAQVNTTVPRFILPYTITHEMAHQLGYAKEEEANFVGYLAATASNDTLFHYSAYLDLFVYANRTLFLSDSVSARNAARQLLPPVKADIKEWRDFLLKHRSPLEPFINWAYGNYLKANQQPQGINSYDEVIADLIAFYKKFGKI
ncbi:MAG: DUF3810 domain-containing protein [Chitinophagaceae bacterium]|nr:DUF3810 domain-containing protein [Chitinophagaceae bacterium]